MSKIQEMRKRFLEGLNHVLEEARHGLAEPPRAEQTASTRRQEFVFDSTPDEDIDPRIDRDVDPRIDRDVNPVAEGMAESPLKEWSRLVPESVAKPVPVSREGRGLRALLRDRKSLRQAVILKEILDKPVSLRRRG